MEHLIAKYLLNDLTLDEQHELSKWLESDKRNAELLRKIQVYWKYHQTDLSKEELEVRLRLQSRIQDDLKNTKVKRHKKRKVFYRIAASLLLVASATLGVIQYNSMQSEAAKEVAVSYVEKVSLPGQRITTVLPDGTQVKMNSESKLIVPSSFSVDKREVSLFGEAFFEVTRDEQRPFIIKTEKIDIKVLGTSFNVQVYDKITPQVAVKTGLVAVTNTADDQTVEVNPNHFVVLTGGGELVKALISPDANPFAWVESQLIFKDETLTEVLDKIGHWYGVKVEVKGDIPLGEKYTGKHDNPTLTEMMDILAFVNDFTYTYMKEEQKIVIQ